MGSAAGLLTRGSLPRRLPGSRQWLRGGGASPLTAAGPSRTRTGFPHRAPGSGAEPIIGRCPGTPSASGSPSSLWAALIFAFSSVPDLGTGLGGWDLVLRKLAHAAEYAVLGALLARALGSPGVAVPQACSTRSATRCTRRSSPGGSARRSTSRSTRSASSRASSSGSGQRGRGASREQGSRSRDRPRRRPRRHAAALEGLARVGAGAPRGRSRGAPRGPRRGRGRARPARRRQLARAARALRRGARARLPPPRRGRGAALRALAAAGREIGVFTDAPEPLARVALAQLGAERRVAALETGDGALDRLLARLGDDAVVVRTRDELDLSPA